ncbi:MAG: hypothetical protein U5Q03_08275 [Bacteroidota bacterium]|nr:hypothetical protein [Bacteroidota bacterium]
MSFDTIEKYVKKRKKGNFALGILKDSKFVPKHIGRSDKDLQLCLKKYIGMHYTYFKYKYQRSEKKAYKQECLNYHHFQRQLDNESHPVKPEGIKIDCPMGCNGHAG